MFSSGGGGEGGGGVFSGGGGVIPQFALWTSKPSPAGIVVLTVLNLRRKRILWIGEKRF